MAVVERPTLSQPPASTESMMRWKWIVPGREDQWAAPGVHRHDRVFSWKPDRGGMQRLPLRCGSTPLMSFT
jgi:hypothetical protein